MSVPTTMLQHLSDDLENLVARAMPAVVGLEVGRGQGTGLVLAQDGYVLTNHHVVREGRKLQVALDDGDTLRGELVGSDPATDLAVVRVDRTHLTTLPLADPLNVRVGQLVVAIGHPYHLQGSVSVGVVSAVDRTLGTRTGMMEGLVQTDAAINPGNSGGPLLNAKGEVVGINTIMLPFAQGIGFAISAGTANWIATLLIQKGTVTRRFLGIAASAIATGKRRAEVGQPRAVRIHRVGRDTPAHRAGLTEGDLVLAINGVELRSVDDLQRMMALSPDERLKVDVWRNETRRTLEVKASPQPVPVAA